MTETPMSKEQPTEIKPVGYYCDHSDEPLNARTHHSWEWDEENGGHTFEHRPNTISSHTGPDQAYLKPENRQRRCPRALPVYAIDAPALQAEAERLRSENRGHVQHIASLLTSLNTEEIRVAELEQAARLGESERTMLAFALDLAADDMASKADEFNADDEAALESLRKLTEDGEPS